MTWHEVPEHLEPESYRYQAMLDNYEPCRTYAVGNIVVHDVPNCGQGYVIDAKDIKNPLSATYYLQFDNVAILCYVSAFKDGKYLCLRPMSKDSNLGPKTMYCVRVFGSHNRR